MRSGSIVSTSIALFVLQVQGAPERKLEALTEGDTLTKMEQFFGAKFERKFKDLPTSARLETAPWNGPIWDTYFDSINYPWKADQPSPTEKYAMAFGLNATELKERCPSGLAFIQCPTQGLHVFGLAQMKRTYAPIVVVRASVFRDGLVSVMGWRLQLFSRKSPCVQSPTTTSNFTRMISRD
ncbi:RxLR-like protein [Plasmopara halstedii]|uniref:RxLR-like protein n=1 Tax=Plasmopara halstedii TaxID=4781 RepID=A0A0P1B0I6_PLAHL|nr:RxLR-like protein [Plasmopara halstedii]CEG48194.1 RxLR-like protein [Plasmopara halstedii]|eukprot:XP_024584563.1 RxLR-like protein [Plasmopara halstedii]